MYLYSECRARVQQILKTDAVFTIYTYVSQWINSLVTSIPLFCLTVPQPHKQSGSSRKRNYPDVHSITATGYFSCGEHCSKDPH